MSISPDRGISKQRIIDLKCAMLQKRISRQKIAESMGISRRNIDQIMLGKSPGQFVKVEVFVANFKFVDPDVRCKYTQKSE